MAATTGAIRAGRAFVEIFADDSKLNGALQAAQNKLRAFGGAVTSLGAKFAGIGTAMTAPFIAATKIYIDAASALVDMSARTGVAVETLSALKFAAEQSGTSIETLERALMGMAKITDKASEEGKAAIEAFDRLGVSAADLESKTPVERFKILADALSKIEDPGERAAMAMKVFGKSGAELLPMLAGGRVGIDELMAKAAELGLVMDGPSAAAAEALGDTIDQLKAGFMGVVMQVGSALVPTLQEFANKLMAVGPQIAKWIGDNRELVVTVAKVAVGIAAIGGTLMVFGQAISLAATAIGGLSAAMKLATANAGILGGALAVITAAVIVVEIMKATDAMKQFNAEMVRAVHLQGQIGRKRDKREQGTIDQANAITDPAERKAFVDDKLDMARKELAGAQGNVRTSQRNVASATDNVYKRSTDALGLNTAAEAARQNLSEAEEKAQSIEQHIADLEKMLQEAITPTPPSETAPDAPTGSGPGALEKAAKSSLGAGAAGLGIGGAAAELGSNLGNLGPATASAGTFSNMAGRVLAGPDSKVVSELNVQTDLLRQLVDNTTEDDG